MIVRFINILTSRHDAQIVLCLFVFVLLSGNSVRGQVEVNGLLVDQTRTLFGREFFREFSAGWGEPEIPIQYNIVMTEYFDARWGSLVVIEVNGREAYRKRMAPRSGDAEQEARSALPWVRRHLVNMIRSNGQSKSPDLKGDGF